MNNRDEIRKELSELAPRLEKVEKQNPFKIPDYYFQNFPDRMIENIPSSAGAVLWTEKLETLLNNFFSLIFRPRYAIPGAVILIAMAVGISLLKNNNAPSLDFTAPFSEIPSEEINEYIIENFEDDDLIAFTGTVAANGFIPSDITRGELEDFLENDSDNQNTEEDFL